ncbi:hypothetical protein HDV57DRAFT_435004 [Trichoderma longibrachiatum]
MHRMLVPSSGREKVCTIVGLAAHLWALAGVGLANRRIGNEPFSPSRARPFFTFRPLRCCEASALPRSLPLFSTHCPTLTHTLVSSLPTYFKLRANLWEGRGPGPQQKLVVVLACLADRHRPTYR